MLASCWALIAGSVVAVNNVYLYSVEVTISDLRFHFQCDAPGLAGYEWLFIFPLTAALGCADYTGVSLIGGGPTNETLRPMAIST